LFIVSPSLSIIGQVYEYYASEGANQALSLAILLGFLHLGQADWRARGQQEISHTSPDRTLH